MIENNFTIATLNVRGLRNKIKRKKIFHWIEKQNYDICCLQETFFTESIKQDIENDWSGTIYNCFSNSNHSKGTSILLNKNHHLENIEISYKAEGRGILMNFDIGGESFCIINIYVPNIISKKKEFIHNLQPWIINKCKTNAHILIAGDLNISLTSDDRTSKIIDQCSGDLRKFLEKHEYNDIWRKMHPSKKQYTFVSTSDIQQRSRIDYILTTAELMKYVTKCEIKNAPAPDHKIITCTLKGFGTPRGKGYWKLNTAFLEKDDYCNMVTKTIDDTIFQYRDSLNKRQLWDMCKLMIKQNSISYGIQNKRVLNAQKNDFEIEFENLENKIENNKCTKNDRMRHAEIRNELDKILSMECKGVQIRSKAQDILNGEKNKNYFKRLEETHQIKNRIIELKNENGKLVSSDNEILNTCVNFYKNLFHSSKPNETNIDNYLEETNNLPLLTDDDQSKCEGLITDVECTNVLKNVKKNKSPGLDGLPAEFYQQFWPKIGNLLVESFNEAFQYGELSHSQKISVLSLIFKSGETDMLSNYRPINLSNFDYKIIAFVLANRMHKILHKLVSSDQTGYVKGRYIGTNIRLIDDIINHCEKNNKKGILLFLDFKKAFDSVEWKFIAKVLDKFNFGPQFKHWIETIYKNCQAKVKNNGYISEPFFLERGIRQGCPVSALLFILVAEILAQRVRDSNTIQGITIDQEEYKLCQYADDTVIFLKNRSYIEDSIKCLETFGKLAGPILNLKKTEMMGFQDQNETYAFGDIKWIKNTTRCLGIYFGPNKEECFNKNWTEKIEKIENLLNRAKCRNLMITEKVDLIKTFVMPKIIFPASMLPTKQETVKKLNQMFWKFIWKGKDKVTRDTCVRPKSHGGIKMVDLDAQIKAIKAKWVQRIIYGEGKWAILSKCIINRLGTDVFLNMNCDEVEHCPNISILPTFYQQVLISYNSCKNIQIPETAEELQKMPIWGNILFKYMDGRNKRRTLFFPDWIDANLKYIKDIPFKNGKLDQAKLSKKVQDHTSLAYEVMILNIALKPFKHLIDNISTRKQLSCKSPTTFFINGQTKNIREIKTKDFYDCIINKSTANNKCESTWENKLKSDVDHNIDFQYLYTTKLVSIKDKKLFDFNFKLLNNIIPCNLYLSKISNKGEKCEKCGQVENIEHMIFFCIPQRYIWYEMSEYLDYPINMKTVLCGNPDFKGSQNLLINYVAYYIFLFKYMSNNGMQCGKNLYKYISDKLLFTHKVYINIEIEIAQHLLVLSESIRIIK